MKTKSNPNPAVFITLALLIFSFLTLNSSDFSDPLSSSFQESDAQIKSSLERMSEALESIGTE